MTTEEELLQEIKGLREDLRMERIRKNWTEAAAFNKNKSLFRRRMGRDPLPGEDLTKGL